MDDNDFSNDKARPIAYGDRPKYRFEDDVTDEAFRAPVEIRQNPKPPGKDYDQFESEKDEKHLDQLSLGFKIYAAINAVFSCFPIIHLVMGIMIVSGTMGDGKDAMPTFFGWFFIIFALLFIGIGMTISICNFYAARFLKEKRNYMFCFVMSCINCMSMPLGTILGVFGIIVLIRDSVKEIFEENTNLNRFG